MNNRDKNKAYFLEHMRDRVQDDYDLSDDQFDNLLRFLSEFDDPDVLLIRMTKPDGRESLKNICNQLLREEHLSDSHKDFKLDPVTMQAPLVLPVSLPLSQDMIIQPHTLYEGN